MTSISPSVEFFEGISEEISDVRLRQGKSSGARTALLIFRQVKALEQFNSFRKRFSNALRLVDEEGVMTIEPSSVKFIFSGPEGDDFERLECEIPLDNPEHMDRFMRFMHRYAQANGMGYESRS